MLDYVKDVVSNESLSFCVVELCSFKIKHRCGLLSTVKQVRYKCLLDKLL